MDEDAFTLLQACKVPEGLFNGDENHGHGTSLFECPRGWLRGKQGCWPIVVCAQAPGRLTEHVLCYLQCVHMVAQLEHGARAIGTRWTRITRVQAHDVQHITEVEANRPDPCLHEAWDRCLPLALLDEFEVRQRPACSHVQPTGATEGQRTPHEACAVRDRGPEGNLVLSVCAEAGQAGHQLSSKFLGLQRVKIKTTNGESAWVFHVNCTAESPETRMLGGACLLGLLVV
mmetsp:Transcript_33449/g.84576  ORF Transcript_33449/g.84576 Transcript_33449/m.84576 type:complete len:230 (-) Transcript_33449:1862-2551(-)